MQRREVERLGGEDVEEVGSGAKGSNPESGRNTGLKQKGTNDIISGTDNSFSFTVLGRSVWAGHAQVNTIGEEEGARARVVKLAPIIALHRFHHGTKLWTHLRKEVSQCGECVRFNTKGKSPQVTRAVI